MLLPFRVKSRRMRQIFICVTPSSLAANLLSHSQGLVTFIALANLMHGVPLGRYSSSLPHIDPGSASTRSEKKFRVPKSNPQAPTTTDEESKDEAAQEEDDGPQTVIYINEDLTKNEQPYSGKPEILSKISKYEVAGQMMVEFSLRTNLVISNWWRTLMIWQRKI